MPACVPEQQLQDWQHLRLKGMHLRVCFAAGPTQLRRGARPQPRVVGTRAHHLLACKQGMAVLIERYCKNRKTSKKMSQLS